MANLIALPIADKLEDKSAREKTLRALIIECIFQVQQMSNPTAAREILEPYLPEKQRERGGGNSYTSGAKDGSERRAA